MQVKGLETRESENPGLENTKDFLWLHLRDLPYFRALIRAVEAHFYQDLDLPSPRLDVGSGDGHFAHLTFQETIDVGIDPWEGPIRKAARLGAYNLLVQGDAGKLPFPDGFFGSAFSNSVLEHIRHIDAVLLEVSRVLQPGAPFVFSVPNPAYFSALDIPAKLKWVGLSGLGRIYTEWFRRISRVQHADTPEEWQRRLGRAGFQIVRWWNYFPPQAMRVLEWGHYFGFATLLPHILFDRWILVPTRWNLALTERLVRPYASVEPHPEGTFTFFIARKQS